MRPALPQPSGSRPPPETLAQCQARLRRECAEQRAVLAWHVDQLAPAIRRAERVAGWVRKARSSEPVALLVPLATALGFAVTSRGRGIFSIGSRLLTIWKLFRAARQR